MLETNPFRLEFDGAFAEALYRKAISEQWSIEADIDWATLTLEQIAPAVRAAMAAIYSHIYHTESMGLRLCGRLVDAAPEGWLRQFTATQVMDEARHVDFFHRVRTKLGAAGAEPDELLAALRTDLASVRDPLELLLYGQVIENAAQTLFLETAKRSRRLMGSTVRLPGSSAVTALFDVMLRLIGRDESRHIAFGFKYLSDQLRSLPVPRRQALETRVTGWCVTFDHSFANLRPQVQRLGLQADELLARVWHVQARQFARLGLHIGACPLTPRLPRGLTSHGT
ncbi:MAG TPA: ferritin-like domain-containing protein [Polyangiales bacterium]|nr:ferritin-like domain-containing protein [Polyangiales bacterium]